MNGFQKWVMELIGLDPYFYRPIDTRYQSNAYRDMSNAQMAAIDDEFKKRMGEESDIWLYMAWRQNKIRPHEFIIEIMRGYDFKKARGE